MSATTSMTPTTRLSTLAAALASLLILAPGLATRAAAQEGVRITQVAAGDDHSCALDAGGQVWCWGFNAWGQLGDGTQTSRATPARVPGLSGATAIVAGGGHSCALVQGGAVRCWGRNFTGQLGDGTDTHRASPVAAQGLSGVTALSAGSSHTCALAPGGLQCWGSNFSGQLGDADFRTNRLTPTPAPNWGAVTAMPRAQGGGHSCMIVAGGGVRCSGEGLAGQLGEGRTLTRFAPVAVQGLTAQAQGLGLGLGAAHSCAVTPDGEARCWGSNVRGRLGDGTEENRTTPVAVRGLSGVRMIDGGSAHSCAITAQRQVWCWGSNQNGQLGIGNPSRFFNALEPARVPGLENIADLAAGLFHTCAVTGAGGLRCWGRNAEGQLGDGTTIDRRGPIEVPGFGSTEAVATTTTLTGPDRVIAGQTASLTARVAATGATPSGNISFIQDGRFVTAVPLNASGAATLPLGPLDAGRYIFTARFEGSPGFAASVSAPLEIVVSSAGDGFVGGGVVFGQNAACAPMLGTGAHGVTLRYSPSELAGRPSGLAIVWPEGSEHLSLWGTMAVSGAFLGGAGRSSWTRFVFYPSRPLIRVVARQVTRPAGADLAGAEELLLRLRAQNFAALPGCAVTVATVMRRG